MAVPLAAGGKNLPLGKGVKANITKGIQPQSMLVCADNSGAKTLKVIGVKTYKGIRRKKPIAGIGDLVICSVKTGTPEMRKKIVKAVIVRQKMPYRRPNGIRVAFEDNAAVIINDDGTPKGTEIKGVIAKEVVEKWNKLSGISSGAV